MKLFVLLSGILSLTNFNVMADDLPSFKELKATYTRPKAAVFPADNPYSKEKEMLGKLLFFDPRLSGQGNLSCVSCHNPGIGWEMATPKGIGAQVMGRKAQTLYNLAFNDAFLWDGRADSIEKVVFIAITSPKPMNLPLEEIVPRIKAVPSYQQYFDKAFPGEGITKEAVSKAIATYVRTMVSENTAFDKFIAGDKKALSPKAMEGFKIFSGKANCVACHSGWNFSDGGFHDIGLQDEDIGRGKQFPTAVPMQHAFKTPTLRNIFKRMPYMHDGSLKTMEDVINHYANASSKPRPSLASELKPFTLTPEEKDALTEFLKSLSSDDKLVAMPNLPF